MNLNVKKPLRRGIFVQVESNAKIWLPFKYETLPIFCYGCRCLGYSLKDFWEVPDSVKVMLENDLSFSVTLKAQPKLVGKLSQKLGFIAKKSMALVLYKGDKENSVSNYVFSKSTRSQTLHVTDTKGPTTANVKNLEVVTVSDGGLEQLDSASIPMTENSRSTVVVFEKDSLVNPSSFEIVGVDYNLSQIGTNVVESHLDSNSKVPADKIEKSSLIKLQKESHDQKNVENVTRAQIKSDLINDGMGIGGV